MAYGQFAYVYDRLMSDMPYGEWIRIAEKAWALYDIRPQHVVDLGCGTGSVSIPLAAAGYRVTGIDLSDDMLAVAQEKYERIRGTALAGAKGTAVWLHQDMREWETSEAVDAVVSFCDCLNYLTEEADIVETFGRTYDGMKPGGVFAFDVHAPRQLEAYALAQPFILDEDGLAYIWTCDYDEERLEVEHQITFFAEESQGIYRRFEETHVQRAYRIEWLEKQLAKAGFTDIHITADFTDREPTAQSQRIFFTARK